MLPRNIQPIVSLDRGPWGYNLAVILKMGRWLESEGHQVWIEVSNKTWLNTQGEVSDGPPQHFKRPAKGGMV